MKKIAVFAALALLSGCATCQQHPGWCATGVAILGTAATISYRGTGNSPVVTRPPFCGPDGAACK